MPKPSDTIRRAIDECGKSRYAICKNSGIDQSVLFRFCTEGRSMSTETLDKIADEIGLTISFNKPQKSKKKAK